MKKFGIFIEGMHCISCPNPLENVLNKKGVKAAIDFSRKEAVTEYDPHKTDEKELEIIQIPDTGYKVKL